MLLIGYATESKHVRCIALSHLLDNQKLETAYSKDYSKSHPKNVNKVKTSSKTT